jgi:fatty-acyl-CoA synthase
MLASSAHAKILIGPAGMKDWVAEIGEGAGLDFAGVLADLPEDDGPLPTITPEDPCYLQFSSGSTRFPDRRAGAPQGPDGQRVWPSPTTACR